MHRWFIASLLALCAVALNAQGLEVTTVANLPTCTDGSPWVILVVDGASSTDCSTGSSSTEVVCTCKDGVIAGLSTSGGSSNSFETMNAPSGTDPVADSSTDTLNWTAGSGITITGDSSTDTITIAATGGAVALDLDDDASDESSALTEIATTNDNGDAFTEPSADKLLIDVSKLRPPSALNPRPTPHANDCEFSSGVCGSWNLHADFSSGTVDPAAQVSGGDIYDCTSWSGWCLFQDYTASTPAFKPGVYLDYTPATEETWWFHVTAGTGGSSTDENRIGLCYRNSGDTNEAVCFGYHSSGGAERIELYVSNNGALTSTCVMALGGAGSDDVVMFLQKDTNDYYAGIVRTNGGGAYGNTGTNRSPYYCGVVTKTGVTTFNRMSMMMGDSDDDPTPIQGIDFIRYAASRTFAFVNP